MRPISDIAKDIRREWRSVNYAAAPYLDELRYLDTIDTTDRTTGFQAGASIIRGFLGSATAFKGETARNLKNELRAHIGDAPVKARNTSGAQRPKSYTVLILWEDGEISQMHGRKSKAEAVKLAKHAVKYGRYDGGDSERLSVDAWRIVGVMRDGSKHTVETKILIHSHLGSEIPDTEDRLASL